MDIIIITPCFTFVNSDLNNFVIFSMTKKYILFIFYKGSRTFLTQITKSPRGYTAR